MKLIKTLSLAAVVCTTCPAFAQLSTQQWDISVGSGYHALKMTSANNIFENQIIPGVPNQNAPISRGQVINLSADKKLNALWRIGLSVNYLTNNTTDMFYSAKSVSHGDTTDVLAVDYVTTSAVVLSVKPSLSVNTLLHVDSTAWGRHFKTYLHGEIGYGFSTLKVNYAQSDSVTLINPYKDATLSGNGLNLGIGGRIDIIMLENEKTSLLGGIDGGYDYFKTGALSGSGTEQFPGLNLDFSGWYIMASLKLVFGRG